jgi:hypothetical protein
MGVFFKVRYYSYSAPLSQLVVIQDIEFVVAEHTMEAVILVGSVPLASSLYGTPSRDQVICDRHAKWDLCCTDPGRIQYHCTYGCYYRH